MTEQTTSKATPPARKDDANSDDAPGAVDQIVAKAAELKDGVSGAQREIAAIEKEGEAAGGLVKAVCDGTGRLRKVTIDPSLMNGEAAVLEELVVNAVHQARESVQDEAGRKVGEMLGGLPLPSSVTKLIAQFIPLTSR